MAIVGMWWIVNIFTFDNTLDSEFDVDTEVLHFLHSDWIEAFFCMENSYESMKEWWIGLCEVHINEVKISAWLALAYWFYP